MSLPYTLLGFLCRGPHSGYDLKRMLDSSTQFFWHAELAQIYPALKELEKKSQVKSEVFPQDGKPDKKVYAITPTGREALLAWLSEPLDETPPIKSPVLLKMFFLENLPREQALTQLCRQLSAQQARLKHFRQETVRQIEALDAAPDSPGGARLWELIRQFGELQAQTSIRWLEMVIEEMEKTL
jgi:PadR family transcriptional regulator AphA